MCTKSAATWLRRPPTCRMLYRMSECRQAWCIWEDLEVLTEQRQVVASPPQQAVGRTDETS